MAGYVISQRIVFAGIVYIVLCILIALAIYAQSSGDYISRPVRARLQMQGKAALGKAEDGIKHQQWRTASQALAQLRMLEYIVGTSIMSTALGLHFDERMKRLQSEYEKGRYGDVPVATEGDDDVEA
jgi:hypothetical protein